MMIVPRVGPMFLVPGHQEGGLEEGCFHFHLAKGSELSLRGRGHCAFQTLVRRDLDPDTFSEWIKKKEGG
jgi:hypothetical protein